MLWLVAGLIRLMTHVLFSRAEDKKRMIFAAASLTDAMKQFPDNNSQQSGMRVMTV
ncbi:hypothetical protein [Methylophilus sp. DW102]|uniref:hypothetical protein n=1 Tax=Methylophilus sp. DW102 TaxID=3095607 RepID=UPI0030878343|nr:hypothetical protein MTDW_06400 [Methylophilus sp. DW102]